MTGLGHRLGCVVATAALLAAAGAALADPAHPPVTRCADGAAVTRVGQWEQLRGPTFTERPLGAGQEVTELAVDSERPQRRYATNGTSIERSDDGGCTWREIHVLPDAPSEEDPQSVAGSRIVELVTPRDPRASGRLLARVQDTGGAPHVLVSDDGGQTPLERRDEGLPPAGEGADLEVAPTNPDFLYLAVELTPSMPERDGPLPSPPTVPGVPDLPAPLEGGTASGPRGALYASQDGGLTWEQRLDPSQPLAATGSLTRLAVDAVAPNKVWAVADGLLRASSDGGRTFRGPGPSEQQQRARGWQVTALASASVPGAQSRVLALSATSAQQGPLLLRSSDGGAGYDEVTAPGPVESLVLLPGGQLVLGTAPGSGRRAGVHLTADPFAASPLFADLTPLPTQEPFRLTGDRSTTPTVHGRSAGALLRLVSPAVAIPPPDLPPVGRPVAAGVRPPPSGGSLLPARDEVTLTVGSSRTVQHQLRPPSSATSLDLYVLLDTSISMADDLDAVSADLTRLVRELRRRGVDLQVGLGEFKGGESSVAYRRVVGVGPDLGALERGLRSVVADGYGLEAQLIALEQSLDGAGEDATDLVPASCKITPNDPDRFVQAERRTAPPTTPGQQADFRPEAVKAVLTVTDTNFLRPAGTRLKPDCTVDVEGVAAAYARKGVHQMGLGLDDVDNPARAADLLLGARTTGATQPPGPPCAPSIDASRGAPAVCRRAVDLLPSLERLVDGATEPVRLEVVTQGQPVVQTGAASVEVDLRRAAPVALPVTYSCTREGAFTGRVEVRLAARVVAALTARIVCTPPAPVPAPPQAAVGLAPLIGLLPPAAPVPPPAPPAQAVQPQVQTQPQAQAQTQVQSGTQDQEQATAQLALALRSGVRDEGLSTRAMSAREVPDVVRLSLLAALTAAAGAVIVRRREAVGVRPCATRR